MRLVWWVCRVIVIFALLAIPLRVATQASAQSNYVDPALQGLRSVKIVVESLDKDAQRMGVTAELLSGKVRGALNNSRARSLKYDPRALPYLYVVLTTVAQSSAYAGTLSLVVERPVEILVGEDHVRQAPSKRVLTTAMVWERSMTLYGPTDGALDQIGRALDRLLDGFVTDYYRANT